MSAFLSLLALVPAVKDLLVAVEALVSSAEAQQVVGALQAFSQSQSSSSTSTQS